MTNLPLLNHLLLFGVASGFALLVLHSWQVPSTITKKDPVPCRVRFYEGILEVNGQAWFSLDKACHRRNGQEVCNAGKRSASTGQDPLGDYQQESVVVDEDWKFWRRSYAQDETTLLFGQEFLDTLKDTNLPAKSALEAAEEGMASWFPAFKVHKDHIQGFLHVSGLMAGGYSKPPRPISELKPENAFQGGPTAFFNDHCVLLMSPASSFMSTSGYFRQDKQAYGFGVMGSVTQIPKGHELQVIVSTTPLAKQQQPDGIRQAFLQWGTKLRTLHHTQRVSDFTTQQLQYSTDNGAFYYYQTEPNKNYQDTILDVKAKADELKLPFTSWLMDSWWYYRGAGKGVVKWSPRPEVFPDGIQAVTKATQWAVVAHNRFWASDTVYAKANGGDYDFAIEGNKALPLEQRFWDDLMATAKSTWGLTVYEQDWLNIQTQTMNYTLQSVNAARNWLLQMGRAAAKHGIPIQYCMSYPRHILQSLEVPQVTQARASSDYWPSDNGGTNWNIGTSSLMLSALHIAPSKDNFWSSSQVQNHTYGGNYTREGASRLHALASAFSAGPVAPSDSIEHLNVTLIMKTCAQDGRLLQPDWPAVPTDRSIFSAAKVSHEKVGTVHSTKTELSGYTYTYVMALVSPSFQLTRDDLYASTATTGGYVAFEVDAPLKLQTLPLAVPASDKKNVHVYALAPLFPNGYAFLGEAETKFVPVSQARFSGLEVSEKGFQVTVQGAVSEVVQLVVRTPKGEVQKIACEIPSNGVAVFTSQEMACH